HAVGQQDAVPVDARRLGQAVGHVDPHPISLYHLDGWAGRGAVIPPAVTYQPWRKLVLHWLSDEVEDLDPTYDFVWQRPAVRGDDRRVVLSRLSRRRSIGLASAGHSGACSSCQRCDATHSGRGETAHGET